MADKVVVASNVILEMIRKCEMKLKRQRQALADSEAELAYLHSQLPKDRA